MRRGITILVASTFVALAAEKAVDRVSELPPVTRSEMMAIARKFAEYKWMPRRQNLSAPCVRNYTCDFTADVMVTGVPYDWGGIDTIDSFKKRLASGQAAGSHSRHGVTNCTAGIDCSGFVSLCWRQRPVHDYSTSTIRAVAGRPKYNIYTDMKPGDALNKPGVHIVLFAGYTPSGNPEVCEASGSAKRVVCRARTWAQLRILPARLQNGDRRLARLVMKFRCVLAVAVAALVMAGCNRQQNITPERVEASGAHPPDATTNPRAPASAGVSGGKRALLIGINHYKYPDKV